MSKSKNASSSITKDDLNEMKSALAVPSSSVPASLTLTSSAFDSLGGEVFAGLNILKLSQGEAAGPFRFLKQVNQEMPAKGKKKAETVVCNVVAHLSFPNREIRLPLSASLSAKIDDAALKAGDVIAVRRVADYVSKNFAGQNCQGYELRVLARSTQTEALAKLASVYPVSE
jgi:hypothetical protein